MTGYVLEQLLALAVLGISAGLLLAAVMGILRPR